MVCIKCGSPVGDNDKFCMNCGTRIEEIDNSYENDELNNTEEVSVNNLDYDNDVMYDEKVQDNETENEEAYENELEDEERTDSHSEGFSLEDVIVENTNEEDNQVEDVSEEKEYSNEPSEEDYSSDDYSSEDYSTSSDYEEEQANDDDYQVENVIEEKDDSEESREEDYSSDDYSSDDYSTSSDYDEEQTSTDESNHEEENVSEEDTDGYSVDVTNNVNDEESTVEDVVPEEENDNNPGESYNDLEIDEYGNIKPKIMSTSNEPIGVGITNSDFDVFGPVDNSYNDVDVFKNPEKEEKPIEELYEEDNTTVEKQPTKSGINSNYITAALIILVAIAIGLLIINLLPESEEKKEDTPTADKGENNGSYNEVVFKNFLFKVPSKYEFSTKGDTLLIGEDNKWGAQIEVGNGSYSKLVSKKSELQSALEKKDYSSTKPDVRSEGGVDFITMEVRASDQNVLLALTEASSDTYFSISMVNNENKIDYYVLDDIAAIVKSSEKIGSSKITTAKNVFAKEFESLAK